MKSPALFLLLLSVSPLLSEASVPRDEDVRSGAHVAPELPVLWDELRGLRELVLSLRAEEVERRQAMRGMESRLRDREVDAEQQSRSLRQEEELSSGLRRKVEELDEARTSELSTLQSRLNVSETSLEQLKKNSGLASELPFLQTRLRANERTVEQLRRRNAGHPHLHHHHHQTLDQIQKQLCVTLWFCFSSVSETLQHRESGGGAEEADLSSSAASERRGNTTSEGRNDDDDDDDDIRSAVNDLVLVLILILILVLVLVLVLILVLVLVQSGSGSGSGSGSVWFSLVLVLVPTVFPSSAAQVSEVTSRLNSTQLLVDQLSSDAAALNNRLSVGERRLDELQIQTTESRSSSALEENRSTVKSRLLHLEGNDSARAAEVSAVTSRLTQAETQTAVGAQSVEQLQVRLDSAEDQVLQLLTDRTDDLKVAFSAGLTDSGPVGPFDEESTLIFSKTFSNVGGAYDPTTGVFTAPVGGVYFFSFSATDYLKGYMGLYLYRNNQPIIFTLDLNDHGGYTSTCSGVALQLEEGDCIRLSLPASYRLYDDSRNFSVFSGFLLFPL
ncbi:hypothetical protein F2P81_002917 [Scophthalmus maximus]|uniref:C1q domain-containing protein n=1 Tax=Scophthalmus maximus TaxID=52904 RepID=A0A6A4TG07_SCOMX|nr:hypothetical protein F2P81_002917 [Scophthalmus maximus]